MVPVGKSGLLSGNPAWVYFPNRRSYRQVLRGIFGYEERAEEASPFDRKRSSHLDPRSDFNAGGRSIENYTLMWVISSTCFLLD